MLYLCFFSIGLGNTPWTVNSEIYPMHLRGVGLSVSTTANWLSNYVVSQLFLTLISTSIGKVLTFVGLSLFCIAGWFFVYILLPETKGRPCEEIIAELCPNAQLYSSHKKDQELNE